MTPDPPDSSRLDLQAMPRLPAEWEPQQCVWVAWPHSRETWPGRFDAIPGFFKRWIKVIADSVPVRILAADGVAKDCRAAIGSGTRNVDLVAVPTDDCWIRDYGPSFVLREDRVEAVNWKFNAWGRKYPPWDQDDAAARKLCDLLEMRCVDAPLCLEGGALECDGQRRMLTTDCLIAPNRNQDVTRQSVASILYQFLGVTEVVWVDGGGLAGDDTDGHIDQLARFIDPTNVVVAVSDDPDDPNHAGLEQNYRQLKLWGQSTEPTVTVHRLPIPPARSINGQRVPESYCNFLRLGPERMLVPTFAAESDRQAVGVLKEIASCEVTAVPSSELAWGLGALHCASRDQPKT